jgi:hypothetical protein
MMVRLCGLYLVHAVIAGAPPALSFPLCHVHAPQGWPLRVFLLDADFYLSESGLVVLETTNHIFDPSVYGSGALTPRSLLSWQRVRAALMIASNGQEWVRTFSALNSGTYNNQVSQQGLGM